MENEVKLPRSPFFIPKVMDKNLSSLPFDFPAILVDTNIINWRPKLVSKLSQLTGFFIVNPATHCLMYKESQDKNNFKKIGYPPIEPERVYGDKSFRKEELIKRCLDDQISKQSTILIAPYFYAEDTDDTKFSLNLTLLAESIQYIQENSIDKPLFAMIHIGNTVVKRPAIVNHIIDRYNDDFVNSLAGYFVNINDLDCEKADLEVLVGLSNFIFRLSEKKPVFVKRIGAFGEILCSIGAYGYSSGLGISESSSIRTLQQSEEERKRKFIKRIYIPEIFDYINDEEAKGIGYRCNCPVCKNSLITSEKDKKLHILYSKLNAMKVLGQLDRENRISYMMERLTKAQDMVNSCRGKYGLLYKTNHLPKWMDVLRVSKGWRYSREEDEELADILGEIDKNQ